MQKKWPIPDINGISYSSTLSIYANNTLIKEFYPGNGLMLAKDPETNECWVFVNDPPPGDYALVIESNAEIILYETGTFPGEKIIPDELPKHSWTNIVSDIPLTDVKTAMDRYFICKSCPQFQDNVCLACGCFLLSKTKIKGESCPQHKW